jgi:DNA polymerase (family X)
VPPELREDQGEFEAALKHEIPDDLVSLQDIQGNVHSHSTWSDGKHTLEEMTKAALALGMKYLTVTEHSQTAGYAGGLKEDDLKRQSDEVDALNEKYKGIRLLKGVESDILEDGRLDYPDHVLEKLDVVICSIHARHGQDEQAMTKRVLTAIQNPFFQIWGHPTGRLIQKRDPAPMRMEEILDACARHGVVVEVNGGPERLDLSAEHVRLALHRGLKICASTDSHSIHELALNLPLAVGTARRGWARRGDIVNAMSVGGFLGSLRKHWQLLQVPPRVVSPR